MSPMNQHIANEFLHMKRILLLSLSLAVGCSPCASLDCLDTSGSPIWPDYVDVTVPASIAPLNFVFVEPGPANVTTFASGDMSVTFRGGRVKWNPRKWRKLLWEARGGKIEVHSTSPELDWSIYVADEDLDYGLQYRLIAPGYELAGSMGIFERDLSSFRQRTLLRMEEVYSCMNCHEYNRGDTDYMSLHVRGLHGSTLIFRNGRLSSCNTRTDSTVSGCAFPYWHPSGDCIAYSSDITRQHFTYGSGRLIETFDEDSDLQVYDCRTNQIVTAPSIKDTTYLETMPSFSADGRTIFFARALKRDDIMERRYDICSVDFDVDGCRIGSDVRTVYDASSRGESASLPRPSYDGRFLMFCVSQSGFMHIYNPASELWLMDLRTGESRPLDECNSPCADSFHNWSSNSAWFVFASRREDNLYSRAYISHIDEAGNCTKPFLLPQRDPVRFYTSTFYSFNAPAFVTSSLPLSSRKIRAALLSPEREDFGFRWSD